MRALPLDVTYAFRQIRRKPGVALVVILTLGIATGLVTSLFTIFNTVRFRTWPVKDPAGIVRVPPPEGFSVAEWRHVSASTKSLAGLIASDGGLMRGASIEGRRVSQDYVSTNYFQVLGVSIQPGRGFLPHEDQWEAPHQVAVISHDLWREAFGGDRDIVGRMMPIKIGDDEMSFTVVGVAPPGFNGTSLLRIDLWLPLSGRLLALGREFADEHVADTGICCEVAGRLAPGVSREQARAELQILSDQFRASSGQRRLPVRLIDAADMTLGSPRVMRDFLFPCLAVTLVLFLACANAGNVLLARARARHAEIALRLALGASRGRIIRQLLTEAFVLAVAAGGLGVGVAWILPRLIVGANPVMSHLRLTPDLRVMAFALALAAMACVAAGLAPALHATRGSVSGALRDDRGWVVAQGFSLREGLLAVQVALCVVLLIPAAMLGRAMPLAATRGLDFDADQILVTRIELPSRDYEPSRIRSFQRQLRDALAAPPYARAMVLADFPPFEGVSSAFRLRDDPPERRRPAMLHQVSNGYFDLVHAPIVSGRNIRPADAPDLVVVVNEALARATWPGAVPIGQTVFVETQALEVVGVVRDAKVPDPAGITPALYRSPQPNLLQIVVMHDAGAGLSRDLSALVARIDPRARAVTAVLSASLEGRQRALRVALRLVGLIGAIALILATFGLFGVFANAVQERTREIGIRVAIGARPMDVFAAAFSTTGRALAVGVCVGTVASFTGTRLLRHLLYGLSAVDPVAYLGVAFTLVLAGVAATYVPARRALQVDPAVALRCE